MDVPSTGDVAPASGDFSSGRAADDVAPSSFDPMLVDDPSSAAWRAAGDVAPASVAPACVDARSAARRVFASGRAAGNVAPTERTAAIAAVYDAADCASHAARVVADVSVAVGAAQGRAPTSPAASREFSSGRAAAAIAAAAAAATTEIDAASGVGHGGRHCVKQEQARTSPRLRPRQRRNVVVAGVWRVFAVVTLPLLPSILAEIDLIHPLDFNLLPSLFFSGKAWD